RLLLLVVCVVRWVRCVRFVEVARLVRGVRDRVGGPFEAKSVGSLGAVARVELLQGARRTGVGRGRHGVLSAGLAGPEGAAPELGVVTRPADGDAASAGATRSQAAMIFGLSNTGSRRAVGSCRCQFAQDSTACPTAFRAT